MIVDFFKNLIRYRVEGAKMRVKEKVTNAQTRAKSKASSKFNEAIDKPLNKAKAKAKAAAQGEQKAKKKSAPKQQKAKTSGGAPKQTKKAEAPGNRPGLFGKSNSGSGGASVMDQDDFEANMKTQAIDVSSMVDDRAQDVVGWIVCLNGALRGRDFRLVTGRNVIGTAADCDIVLTDPYLSSKHVVVRHENGVFMLIDLDSTNGCFVNDRRVNKQELIDNDKIRIGRTEMKFKSLF